MLEAFTLFVALQLAGEALAFALGIAIPGPVIGLALLLALLAVLPRPPAGLDEAADGLLSHLSLMLVPAGVGVVAQAALIVTHGVALGLVVIVSTLITLATTALVFMAVTRLQGDTPDGEQDP